MKAYLTKTTDTYTGEVMGIDVVIGEKPNEACLNFRSEVLAEADVDCPFGYNFKRTWLGTWVIQAEVTNKIARVETRETADDYVTTLDDDFVLYHWEKPLNHETATN